MKAIGGVSLVWENFKWIYNYNIKW
jgi:hypothetical protein